MTAPIIVFVLFSTIIILISGNWDHISSSIPPDYTWGLYSKNFLEGILSNAHGTIIDLFVIGVVIFWFEKRREDREEKQRGIRLEEREKERAKIAQENDINRNREILADLRFYRSPDAPYRVIGAARRLLKLGEKKLELSETDLSNFTIKDLNLSESNLYATIFRKTYFSNVRLENCKCEAAIFSHATLKHTTFVNSKFQRANFESATLKGIDFTTCDITWAKFHNANLSSANFKGVDCKGASFIGCKLRSANFIGAKNLPPEILDASKKANGPKI